MELFKTPHIKFMKYKYVALAVTGAIVLAGILNVTLFHGLKPGVDFGGGTLIRVEYKDAKSISQVRKLLADAGIGNSSIQETGKKGHEFQIRTMQVVKTTDEQQEIEAHEKLANSVIEALRGKGPADNLTVISRETVGPQAGKDLRKKATQATIWALIAMLIYIAVRFKIEYGVAAIFTLTQDVLITMTFYSFTNREINLPIIASGTVFLTLLALFLFGGEVINDFAFIMLIGTIEGVYSTIYLSCPVVLIWQKTFKTQKGFRR